MTKPFTKEEVRYYANFARIAVSEEEAGIYAEKITELIGFSNQLKDVDTESIAPMTHPLHQVNVLREDVPKEILDRDDMLKSVKEHEDGMIKVPNILS